jgi:hypothetical protein
VVIPTPQGFIHCREGIIPKLSMTVVLQVIVRVSPAMVAGGGITMTLGGGRAREESKRGCDDLHLHTDSVTHLQYCLVLV